MASGRICPGGDALTLAVLPDAPCFEQNVFKYFAAVHRLPVSVFAVASIFEVPDARAKVLASDYIITKTGDLGPAWTSQQAGLLTEELADPSSELGRTFHSMREYGLPDGSVGMLYRRIQCER